MPYKIEKRDDKWCVINKDTGEDKGCSDTHEMAIEHMRALYAHESKEAELESIMDEIKITLGSDIEDAAEAVKALADEYLVRSEKAERRSDVSEADKKRAVGEYGDVTYADPTNKKYPIDTEEHIRAAWNYIGQEKNQAKYSSSEVASIKRKIVAAWKKKVDPKGPPGAKKEIVDVLKSIVDSANDALQSIFTSKEDNGSDMMIWKEGDTYRWIARYSNNFRDQDNPPEIISADSWRRFVDLVDKGLAPLPELEIWHMKSLKIGEADWVAYDDSGFPLAGGHSLPGTEEIFEVLPKIKNLAMSHGMPYETIKRDPNDNSIIIEHETREISVLPSWSAANKITGFAVLKSEEVTMIPDEKKKKLSEEWGLSEAQISAIEAINAEDAQKATEAGIESKEVKEDTAPDAPVVEATATAEPVEPAPAAPETVAEPSDPALNVEQVREALQTAITQSLAPLEARLTELEGSLKELQRPEEERIVKAASGTPMASLAALLGQAAQSVVGNSQTAVDGRTSLAKSKPTEADANPAMNRTLVPFIDELLASKQ